MKRVFFALCLSFIFAACTNNDDLDDLYVESSEESQSLSADITRSRIVFTAQKDWKATVMNGQEASQSTWITLDKYQGGSGIDIEVGVTLSPNVTTVARKAIIVISSGSISANITVIQKGTTGAGEEEAEEEENITKKLIVEASCVNDMAPSVSFNFGFVYDEKYRITSISQDSKNYVFKYTFQNDIVKSAVLNYTLSSGVSYTRTYLMNDQGYISSMSYVHQALPNTATHYEYDKDGYWTESKYYRLDKLFQTTKYEWKDGNLMKETIYDIPSAGIEIFREVKSYTYYDNTVNAKFGVDANALNGVMTFATNLFTSNHTQRVSKNLIKSISSKSEMDPDWSQEREYEYNAKGDVAQMKSRHYTEGDLKSVYTHKLKYNYEK